MKYLSDSIVNEVQILTKYGFVPTNYNGISVWFNSKITSHYNKARNRKSKLVIHHTAGGFEGDLVTLLKPNKVSTAFLISPEGRIVMLFQPWNWAWHLGPSALGGNTNQSMLSIAIEISNWGYLVPRGEILYTYMGKPYCTLEEQDYYDKTKEWKVVNSKTGERAAYFCKYRPEQYQSLKILVDKLCKLYAIPKERFLKGYNSEVIEFKGITTHTDFRTDKFDLSPNFKWELIL